MRGRRGQREKPWEPEGPLDTHTHTAHHVLLVWTCTDNTTHAKAYSTDFAPGHAQANYAEIACCVSSNGTVLHIQIYKNTLKISRGASPLPLQTCTQCAHIHSVIQGLHKGAYERSSFAAKGLHILLQSLCSFLLQSLNTLESAIQRT